MSKLFYIPLFLCLSLQVCSPASKEKETTEKQDAREKGLQVINRQAAEAYVGFLASDLLEGRQAGMRGSRIAAEYIASCLKEIGTQPLYKDTYEQPFDVYRWGGTDRFPRYGSRSDALAALGNADEKLSLYNVIGKIEGRNPDEYVIVGAHFDHVGVDPQLQGDSIYNGADDNASGVSAVLQVARAFLATGVQPERTVIFALWDGEERGLLGSRYFVDNFADMKQVKAYLNFDMIGRDYKPDQPKHVAYFYSEEYPVFGDWLKDAIDIYGLNLTPVYNDTGLKMGGSDHLPFSLAGIPVLWYFTGLHSDYHKPSDHADKLNWSKMVEITKAAFLIMWNLANEKSY